MGLLDYLVLGSLFLVVGVFVFTVVVSERKLPDEKGEKEILKVRCEGRFGRLTAKYPFTTVSLYERFLVVGHMKKYRIDYDQITGIYEKTHGLSTAVNITHTARGVPSAILLWRFGEERRRKLIEIVDAKRKKKAPTRE